MTNNEKPQFRWDEYGNLVLHTVDGIQSQVDSNSRKIGEVDKKWADNFKWLIGALLSVCILIVGLVIFDIRSNRELLKQQEKTLTQLKADFGSVLMITRPDHIQAVQMGYDTFIRRYWDYTSRSADPLKEEK